MENTVEEDTFLTKAAAVSMQDHPREQWFMGTKFSWQMKLVLVDPASLRLMVLSGWSMPE